MNELRIKGRLPLVKGRRFKRHPKPFIHDGHDYGIVGKRGWFEFICTSTTPSGKTIVECWGPFTKSGAAKGPGYHSLPIEEIGEVERRLPRVREES